MDDHQQPGALDALIRDGLTMQEMAPDLDQLMHEGVQEVLGNHFNDAPLSSLGKPPLPSTGAEGNGEATAGTEMASQMRETNGSGIPARPRRRAAPPLGNFGTDGDISEDEDDDELDIEEGEAATGSSGRPEARGLKRRRGGGGSAEGKEKKSQHMKGRFSGRLPTKEDERRLADECQLMGPLLSQDGELSTLPTIIRAMAKGVIRSHLEKEHAIKHDAMAKLAVLQAQSGVNGSNIMSLAEENLSLKNELLRAHNHIAMLERQQGIGSATSLPEEGRLQTMASLTAGTTMAVNLAPSANALSIPAAPQSQHVVLSTAPSGGLATAQMVQVSAGTNFHAGGQVLQMANPETQTTILAQQLLLDGTTQPVVMTTMQPTVASASMLHVPSSTQLVPAAATAQPVVTASSAEPSAAATDGVPAAAAAGVAAINLNEHAQHLAATASLHGAAKTEAAVQAQHLAVQAQQHAQASVQAAQQAEELKKTLSVLPDSQQVQQAAVTVQTLEARAQAHASITTQVVAQARDMHEKAQVHEKEQLKMITQATVLQAHAQSLHASAAQLEAHVPPGGGGGGGGASGGPTHSGASAEPQMMPPATSAQLSSLHVVAGGQTGTNIDVGRLQAGSTDMPLTSADVGPPLTLSGQQDATRNPTTPHTPVSDGNVFATMAAASAGNAQAQTTALVTAAAVPAQQLQVLVSQQQQQQQPASMPQQAEGAAAAQLSTVQADAAALMQQASASAVTQQQAQQQQQMYLTHQPSGDFLTAADASSGHLQQIAMQLQKPSPQPDQAIQMVPAAVTQPVTLQTVLLCPSTDLPRASSHGFLPSLVNAGSSSVLPASAENAMSSIPAVAVDPSVPQPQRAPVTTAGVEVDVLMPPPRTTMVTSEPTPSEIAADMDVLAGPVVSIPQPPPVPVVSLAPSSGQED